MKLQCLAPQITDDEVRKLFTNRWRQFRLGRFLFDTSFYFPYHLFRVRVQNGKRDATQFLAIDAVTGNLDLYRFDSAPTDEDFLEVETPQFGPMRLSEDEAFMRLQEKVQRSVYQQGFFQIADLRITGKQIALYYFPYQAGFYQRSNQLKIEVVDLIRGRFEGAKVREMVESCLVQDSERKQ